eukprot:8752362-Lingulodinium_polyedra.AAC.1
MSPSTSVSSSLHCTRAGPIATRLSAREVATEAGRARTRLPAPTNGSCMNPTGTPSARPSGRVTARIA